MDAAGSEDEDDQDDVKLDKEIGRTFDVIHQLDKVIDRTLDEIRQNASSSSLATSSSLSVGNNSVPSRATRNTDNSEPGVVENTRDMQVAACQTAIRTLDDNEDADDHDDKIHPNLAAAPTVVDLDEEETINVPGDDCENKTIMSALSSPDDRDNHPAEESQVPRNIPLLPPALKISGMPPISENFAADRAFAGGLNDGAIEKKHTTAPAAQQTQPTSQQDIGFTSMTMEDLNAEWLYQFLNPFATFVEETLQSCSDSEMATNVEKILWPDLMSIPQALGISSSDSSGSCAGTILPPRVSVRTASATSAAGPSFADDRELPAEAGIEVRPLKSS